jgi:cation:H+ antiporter
MLAAQMMVEGASNFARAIGVSDLVIGVTMVAFGTSLPELATSLTAAFKGQSDIAVGNVIGSNIANLLLVLGGASTIATINIGGTDLSVVEYVVMIAFSVMLWPFARQRQLSRFESALFLGAYFAFIFYSFFGG